jgi:hypothetical protein
VKGDPQYFTADAAGGGRRHEDAVVRGLVEAGYARVEPTGGTFGSVKITAEGRAAYAAEQRALRLAAAEAS